MKEEFKMKKIMTAIIISAFVIALGGTTAFAVGRGRQETSSTAGIRQYSVDYTCPGTEDYFTDTGGDGICDYRNTSGSSEACPYLEDPAVEYRCHSRCTGDGTGIGAGNGARFGRHGAGR